MRRRPSWLGRQVLKAIGMEDESFWSTWTPLGNTPRPGTSDMAKVVGDGLLLDVIMTPVMWIARRMAESDIGVQTGDDDTIDHKHPIAQLLRWPNMNYAGSTMRMALTVNYFMDGNAYIRKLRDARGGVVGLLYLPTWTIEPILKPGPLFYQYRPGFGSMGSIIEQMPVLIPAEDIVHLRFGVDPTFTLKGISPLKILLRELFTDIQGATMTAMLMKNAGLMGVVISPKQGVTLKGQPAELKKEIKDEFLGTKNGEPMILTAPTDFQYFGADAAKMDLSKLRNIPEGRVCAMLNIPAAVVGMTTGISQTKVGATLMELRAMAYEDCIIPTQNSWCDELDIQLMPDFEPYPRDFSCQFDNSKVRVLQPDDNAIHARLRGDLLAGGIMLSEFKDGCGYDTTPDEDVYYIPNTITVTDPKELIPPPPPAPVITPPGAKPSDANQNAPDGQPTIAQGGPKNGKAIKTGLHGPAKLTPKMSRMIHRLTRDGKKAANAWESKLADEFRKYGDKVASRFKQVASRLGAKVHAGNGNGLKDAPPDWIAIGLEALQISAADRDLVGIANSYGGQFLDMAKMTYETINATIGLGVDFNDYMQSAVLKTGGRKLGMLDLPVETKDSMFTALEEARAQGLGADAMAKVIAQKVSAGPWKSAETRAQVIARTETKFAQNWSALEAYRSSENISDVLVFDALLGPTDEECEAINGETVSLGEAMTLMESEHPNGTRCFAPVVT
jgi:HK97 family phage portal protein